MLSLCTGFVINAHGTESHDTMRLTPAPASQAAVAYTSLCGCNLQANWPRFARIDSHNACTQLTVQFHLSLHHSASQLQAASADCRSYAVITSSSCLATRCM